MTYGFKHKSRRRRLSWKGSGLALCPLITLEDPDDLLQTVLSKIFGVCKVELSSVNLQVRSRALYTPVPQADLTLGQGFTLSINQSRLEAQTAARLKASV